MYKLCCLYEDGTKDGLKRVFLCCGFNINYEFPLLLPASAYLFLVTV